MSGVEQHAATLRAFLIQRRWFGNDDEQDAAVEALDELVALAGRAEAAEQEAEKWRREERMAVHDAQKLERRAEAAEARADQLQRERDEALRQGGMTLDSLSVMVDKRDAAVASAEQARREADQLRAALVELAELSEWGATMNSKRVREIANAALAGVQTDECLLDTSSSGGGVVSSGHDPRPMRGSDRVQADNKDSA